MYDEQPGEAGQLHYLLEQIEVRRAELDRLRRDIDDTLAGAGRGRPSAAARTWPPYQTSDADHLAVRTGMSP